jgi:diguanylate cyclase (GGDEF)-like protein
MWKVESTQIKRKPIKLKILAADQDPELLELIATRLEPRGYEVVRMQRSEEVMFYLEQEKVELILLSTEIDRMQGSGLIERLRGLSHLVTTPIVLIAEKENLADLIVAGDRGFDDFLIKPFDSFTLQLRVSLNISRIQDRIDANALSHLPGNHAIERVVSQKIAQDEKFSVLYIDINNFKTFNDRYGFEQGDDVIRHTSKIMLAQARKMMKKHEYFIGHIGGDDFVAVVNPEYEEAYARSFLEEFDRIAVTYYSEEDRERGCVRVTNRKGKKETFPLMSCSVAACNNVYRDYKSLAEIATDAAEVKSFFKISTRQ